MKTTRKELEALIGEPISSQTAYQALVLDLLSELVQLIKQEEPAQKAMKLDESIVEATQELPKEVTRRTRKKKVE